jgi:hypothetical protein
MIDHIILTVSDVGRSLSFYGGRFRIPIIEYGKQQPLLTINNLLCRALCTSMLRSALL